MDFVQGLVFGVLLGLIVGLVAGHQWFCPCAHERARKG
jgi:hypothetical protein